MEAAEKNYCSFVCMMGQEMAPFASITSCGPVCLVCRWFLIYGLFSPLLLPQEKTKIHDLLKEEKMLCWGYWSLGHPGEGNVLQAIITEPRSSGFIHEKSVKEVACGENHSIFLLEDGEVYTCGLNRKGQLGHEREGSKPGKVVSPHLQPGACSHLMK